MMDFEVLDAIADLRRRTDGALQATARTLTWFSQTFTKGTGAPRDFWTRMNRPGPQRSRSLPYAFDIWHAIVHAERAIRDIEPDPQNELQSLRDEFGKLTHKVSQRIEEAQKSDGVAALLLADRKSVV